MAKIGRPEFTSEQFAESFWSRVDKSGDCWIWTGATRDGYGVIRRRLAPDSGAHRVAWELTIGPIGPGLNVCHHCDVPLCVRPDHLFLGTQSDNLQDASRKGRLGKFARGGGDSED